MVLILGCPFTWEALERLVPGFPLQRGCGNPKQWDISVNETKIPSRWILQSNWEDNNTINKVVLYGDRCGGETYSKEGG